jgi:hypothetical protein
MSHEIEMAKSHVLDEVEQEWATEGNSPLNLGLHTWPMKGEDAG